MRWTSRKFWGWVFCEYMIYDLLHDKLISSDQFMTMFLALALYYFGSNVISTGLDKYNGRTRD